MLLKLSTYVAVVAVLALVASSCRADHETAKLTFLESGNRYLADGMVREAIAEYRNALDEDPRFGEARLGLAEAYAKNQDPQRALREYVRAADLMPANRDAQLKAAGHLLLAGQFEDAKARADRLLATNPKDIEAQILVGHSLAGLKDLDRAIGEIEEAVQLEPGRSSSYLSLAGLQMASGRVREAEAALRKAIEIDPRSIDARVALGYFYWNARREGDVEATLKEALALDPANALANRLLASFYIATRRAPLAERHLRALADRPTNPGAKLTLADYLAALGRTAEALGILQDVATADRGSNFGPATVRIARLRLEEGKPQEAHTLVREVLSRNANDVEALVLHSQLLAAEGKVEDALEQATRAAGVDPRSTRAYFAVGVLQALRNRPEEAALAFNEVLRLNPRAARAQVELASLNLSAGRLTESVQFAERAVRNAPQNLNTNLMLVRTLVARGDLARAEPPLRKLVEAYPKIAAVHTRMGSLLLRKQNLDAARASFERAVAIEPTDVEAVAGLAEIDLRQKRAGSAVGRVERLLNQQKSQEAFVLMARTYAASGQIPKATDTLKQAIALDTGNLQAYGMLGSLYVRQRRLDEALREFDELSKRETNPVAANTMVAWILESQQRQDEARRRYEGVLERDPDSPVAANNLAWLYAERGENLDVALQLAQTATRGLPNDPAVNDTLGWVYYKRNLANMAVPVFLKSIEKAPDNPFYHFHLGLAYIKAGDGDRARRSLEQALRLNPKFAGADEARRALGSLGS